MLTKGLVKKKYSTMFFAILAGFIVDIIGEFADCILAGIFISEEAVAATELVTPIIDFGYFVALIVGVGFSNKFSQYTGAFKTDEAQKLCGMGLLLSLFSGGILMLLMNILREPFFRFYQVGPEIKGMAMEYYSYISFLLFIFPLTWYLYYLVSVDGDATLIVAIDTVSFLVNTAVSCLLVTHIGIKGLAIGSISAVALSRLLIVFHFRSKKNSIRFKFCFRWKYLWESLVSGSAYGMGLLYIGIVNIVMNRFVIDRFGEVYLAAYALVNFLLNFGEIFMSGVEAGTPFICSSYGEGNTISLRRILKICFFHILGVSSFFAVLFFALAKYIPLVYGIDNPLAFDAAFYSARVLSLSYPFIAFVYMWSTYLPQIGKPLLGNFTKFFDSMIGPIALAIPMGIFFGYRGMIWGFFLASFLSMAFTLLIILLKYGPKGFPFAVVDTGNVILVHEFAVNKEEIVALQAVLHREMKDLALEEKIMAKVELTLEEVFMLVHEKNTEQKLILADCSVIVGPDQVRLTLRDNGVVFNVLEDAQNLRSLRHYVAARMMDASDDTIYMTSISLNRSSYVWKRGEMKAK